MDEEETTITMDDQPSIDNEEIVLINEDEKGEEKETEAEDKLKEMDNEHVDNPTEIISKEECEQTTITMDDEVTSPNKILSKEDELTIEVDKKTSMDNEKIEVTHEIPIIENNDNKHTSIIMDDQPSIDNEEVVLINEYEKGEEKEIEAEDDQTSTRQSPVQPSFWHRPCYSSPNCPSGLFQGALPATMVIVGIIYSYNGYSIGKADYNCAAQPLLPVFFLVWGCILLLNVLSCQFHKHIDERKYLYFLIYNISPIFLIISAVLILRIIPPTVDDSSKETYCPPFLYWLYFTCFILFGLFYSCVALFLWCANQLLG